jgi:hypothetical protein
MAEVQPAAEAAQTVWRFRGEIEGHAGRVEFAQKSTIPRSIRVAIFCLSSKNGNPARDYQY